MCWKIYITSELHSNQILSAWCMKNEWLEVAAIDTMLGPDRHDGENRFSGEKIGESVWVGYT